MKQKPCKWCGATNHQSWRCFKKPRQPLANHKLRFRTDVPDPRWVETRHEWLHHNPPPYSGGYSCHYCKRWVAYEDVTLDHKLSRSNRPDLKYDLSNLVAACAICNFQKGSLSEAQYLKHLEFAKLKSQLKKEIHLDTSSDDETNSLSKAN